MGIIIKLMSGLSFIEPNTLKLLQLLAELFSGLLSGLAFAKIYYHVVYNGVAGAIENELGRKHTEDPMRELVSLTIYGGLFGLLLIIASSVGALVVSALFGSRSSVLYCASVVVGQFYFLVYDDRRRVHERIRDIIQIMHPECSPRENTRASRIFYKRFMGWIKSTNINSSCVYMTAIMILDQYKEKLKAPS